MSYCKECFGNNSTCADCAEATIARLKEVATQYYGRKHNHDHDYFHEDCGLCQIEKGHWEKFEQALSGATP